jgi:hypothetical protein
VATGLIELQYFPPIAYFSLIKGFSALTVEKFEHYQKQTYRNRCYIKTANGVVALVVPLVHNGGKTAIRDVRIDHGQKWVNNHWRTIQSAYGKAPFYEYYHHLFHDILFKKPAFLYDLNLEILKSCLSILKQNIELRETSTFEKTPGIGIKDCRSVLNPKKADNCNRFFKSVKYQQVFGSKFVDNLSIIDLIFCEGPGAVAVVNESAVNEQIDDGVC